MDTVTAIDSTAIDFEHLHHKRDELRKDRDLYRAIGLVEDAEECTRKIRALSDALAAVRNQKHEAERETRLRREEADEAAATREAARQKRIAATMPWLTQQLDGGPVLEEELLGKADAAGFGDVIRDAASELGVWRCWKRGYRGGTKIRHGDPAWWSFRGALLLPTFGNFVEL